jgi:hypothetical protein
VTAEEASRSWSGPSQRAQAAAAVNTYLGMDANEDAPIDVPNFGCSGQGPGLTKRTPVLVALVSGEPIWAWT